MCNLHSLIFTLCLVSVFNAFYTIRMCRGHMLSQSTHKKRKYLLANRIFMLFSPVVNVLLL